MSFFVILPIMDDFSPQEGIVPVGRQVDILKII
jgi:hypothetical protein